MSQDSASIVSVFAVGDTSLEGLCWCKWTDENRTFLKAVPPNSVNFPQMHSKSGNDWSQELVFDAATADTSVGSRPMVLTAKSWKLPGFIFGVIFLFSSEKSAKRSHYRISNW